MRGPKSNNRYATWDNRFHSLAAIQFLSTAPAVLLQHKHTCCLQAASLTPSRTSLKAKTEPTRNRNKLVSLRPEQSGASALTWFGVGVSVSLGAAVGRCLLVVLLLGEAKGKGLAGARRAARLRVSQPAVAAALLGSIWEMERHTPLGLKHPRPPEVNNNKKAKNYSFKKLLLSFKKVRVYKIPVNKQKNGLQRCAGEE